ncbi:hypothetical protein [Micromonospora sp. RTGN7]|uniref:hypothetical protein n=1 Tax=Micromonospora sp. RTGN7 TaxID=3016526 RepID=UPI0029FF53F8|nr:hypothetical protein [Micromonospora sp. RTGN7]
MPVRVTPGRVVVTRRWRVSGAPSLADHRGRPFRVTELVVTAVDGRPSTTAVHGLLRGTSGPYGGRYTEVTWHGPWEWQVPPLPAWIADAVAAGDGEGIG